MDRINNTQSPPPLPPRSPLRDAVYMDRAISLMAPLSPQNSSGSCAITFSSSEDESVGNVESLRSRPTSGLWAGQCDSCSQSIPSSISASREPSIIDSGDSLDVHALQLFQYHTIVERMRDAYMTTRPSTPATPTTPSATSGSSTPTTPASSFASMGEPDWFSPLLTEKPKSLQPKTLRIVTDSISTDAMFDMIDQLPQTPTSQARDFSWFDVSVTPASPTSSIRKPYWSPLAQSPAVSRLSLFDVPGRTSSLKRSKRRSRV